MEPDVTKRPQTETNEYWDLEDHYASHERPMVYTDWEGFTGPKDMKRELRCIDQMTWLDDMGKDLVLHMACESRDQAIPLTNRALMDIGAALGSILGCRNFMKSGIEWSPSRE
jgi:hypothetical protein